MKNKWIVTFIDDDMDKPYDAQFDTQKQAQDWIKSQEIQGRYDPCGFEVIKGPYQNVDSNKINESDSDIKIWVDDIRPAPNGYIWIKSVNDFIDYLVENGINDIVVFDFDHDAGDYQNDGGDYIKCLDYLEFIGADNINIRLHSSNLVNRNAMRDIINKNDWNEVFDIFEDNTNEKFNIESLVEEIYEDSNQLENLDEVEDTETKSDIVDVLKKASKDFQKSASNTEPDQFAKIVVAFDDLIGGVGKYDFKSKKQTSNASKNKKPKDITKRKKS